MAGWGVGNGANPGPGRKRGEGAAGGGSGSGQGLTEPSRINILKDPQLGPIVASSPYHLKEDLASNVGLSGRQPRWEF